MKDSLLKGLAATALVIAIAEAALLASPYASLQLPAPQGGSASAPPLGVVISTVFGGFLVALLVFLILDRWRRIESEMLSLRQAQEKALDDVRKRADDKITEKLDTAVRQAQAIRDHVSNLADRYPWIKGIADADFTPDSCSCQIVLRNAARFVAQGQDSLAHEYLFNWTRTMEGRPKLEGSVYDFMELARFSAFVLQDEHLAHLMIGEGYKGSSRQLLLGPVYLKNLIRYGMHADAFALAESIRRRVFPTWMERMRRNWRVIRSMGLLRERRAKPFLEEYLSIASFESSMGDAERFNLAIQKADEICVTERDRLLIGLSRAEGLAVMGEVGNAEKMVKDVDMGAVIRNGLTLDFVWAMRRCCRHELAYEAFEASAAEARGEIHGNGQAQEDPGAGDEEEYESGQPTPQGSRGRPRSAESVVEAVQAINPEQSDLGR